MTFSSANGVGRDESVRHGFSVQHIALSVHPSWWSLTLLIGTLWTSPSRPIVATPQSNPTFVTTLYRFAFRTHVSLFATFYRCRVPRLFAPGRAILPAVPRVALARAAASTRFTGSAVSHVAVLVAMAVSVVMWTAHDASPVNRLMLARSVPVIGSRRRCACSNATMNLPAQW